MTRVMVVQLGLATMPGLGDPRSASGFTSGMTSGTSGSWRKAEELSTHTVPAAATSGRTARDTVAPADHRESSTPRRCSSSSGRTGNSSPRNEIRFPSDRGEASGTSSSAGKSRSSRVRTISRPTAPVAPTTATRIRSNPTGRRRGRGRTRWASAHLHGLPLRLAPRLSRRGLTPKHQSPAARNRQRRHHAQAHQGRPHPDGGGQTVDEGGRGRVAAHRREHRGQHGHAEHPADLADGVVDARGLPFLLPPAITNGATRCPYGTAGELIAASQASAPDIRAMPDTSRGRLPIRSDSAPASGAIRIGMPVHGRVRSPACSGEYPCTTWKNWASRKIEPNIPKYISSEVTLAAENSRFRKNRMGTMGARDRTSQATKEASRTPPRASGPATPRLPQPCSLARTRPNTMPNSPALASPSPGRSRDRFVPVVSVSRARASGRTTSPMGTFSQKIQFQEMPSTTAPPTSGPMAMASPPTPPQAPNASPRRSGETAAERMVRVRGVTMAPPTPCAARATIRAPMLGASAAAADPAVNTARPIANIRLRPNRSPSAAPVSKSTAYVSVYAFTVHSSPDSDAPRSRLITGRAVVTTRLSSATMNSATDVMANAHTVLARSVIVPPSFQLVSHHLVVGRKRERDPAAGEGPPHASAPFIHATQAWAQPASRLGRSMAAATFISMPSAKKARTASGGAPEARSTNR